jgi:hypothetical protein
VLITGWLIDTIVGAFFPNTGHSEIFNNCHSSDARKPKCNISVCTSLSPEQPEAGKKESWISLFQIENKK